MTIRDEDVATIAGGGGEVRTASGDKIGRVGQIYLDDDSGHPSWVTVKTGLFGTQESFVPLGKADVDGADIVVPYDKETIKGAPRVDTGGSLTPQEEKRLFAYYFDAQTIGTDRRRDDVDTDDDRSRDLDADRDSDERRSAVVGDRDRDGDDLDRDRDRDRDGDRDDDQVGGTVGSPRLRRYVVTEKVVPVSSEEVPVDDDRR